MSVTAKLFRNGRNQAIRIPNAFAFKGIDEVTIEKVGDTLVIAPARKSWASFAQLSTAGDDFMQDRPELLENDKVSFE